MGGNKKGNFTEAWVEFEKKKTAKRVAASLNNTPVGGKKSDFYASDLWNMKYLHKFKWSDLTEKIGKRGGGTVWAAPLSDSRGVRCRPVLALWVGRAFDGPQDSARPCRWRRW